MSGTPLGVAHPDSESQSTRRTSTLLFVGFREQAVWPPCRRAAARPEFPASPLSLLVRSAAAMGILEKISEIEKEIARTQKNKGEGLPDGAFLSARFSFPVC